MCGRGVRQNSLTCTECNKWIHKRCSGLQSVTGPGARDFVCSACRRREQGNAPQPEDILIGPSESGVVEEEESFCYLGSIVDRQGDVERAIRSRISTAWSKWREIAGLLCSRQVTGIHNLYPLRTPIWSRIVASDPADGNMYSEL